LNSILKSSKSKNDHQKGASFNKQNFNFLQQFQDQLPTPPTINQNNSFLIRIEGEIQRTYKFYLQAVRERRDYLIREMQAIAQYALFTQNKTNNNNNSDLPTATIPNNSDLNNNLLSNGAQNPLKSIEFTSNFSAINTSIRNTFGYLRINQTVPQAQAQAQAQAQNQSQGQGQGQLRNQIQTPPFWPPTSAPSQSLTTPLTVTCPDTNTTGGLAQRATNSSGYSSNSYGTSSSASSTSSSASSSISSSSYRPKAIGNSSESSKSLLSISKKDFSMFSNNVEASPVSTFSNNNNNDFLKDLLTNKKLVYNQLQKNSEGWSSLVNNKNSQDDDEYQLPQQSSSPPPPPGLLNSKSCISSLVGLNDDFIEASSFPNDNICETKLSPSSHYSNNSQELILPSPLTSNNLHNTSRTSDNSTSLALAIRPLLKRSKMIYNCKFGEFGINDGQFTEPSGVSINTTNDIIVADTNSHRIQIFDREGRFKFKFGECGKRDGQLLYPNRVAVVKSTGDIVVTERSPTHQIQIYNKYGMFLRKFGANILQHPRGVCVDDKGRIIVVECKVMRVIIFDLMGNVLQKFNCSKYLEFPNGVCCSNEREEIFISDNRAHCIKVFDYSGVFIRQIGGEGITNYPIGVGINSLGQVLVADNHNNFNLTVFTQEGQLICALESKVKHAQCFDVGLMDDGSIVLASKDYRIYVYKYNNSTNQLHQVITGSKMNYQNDNFLLSPSAPGVGGLDCSFSQVQPSNSNMMFGDTIESIHQHQHQHQHQSNSNILNISDSSNNNFLLSSISNLCSY
jgi:hypothetical protein